MTSAVQSRPQRGVRFRLTSILRDVIFGTLLCLTPVTALLALGWMTRRMAFTVESQWHGASERPGWVMGRSGEGWWQRVLGGLAANVESGLRAALGLFLLTLPFTLAWLGAWWAGWENSFNKGYEQSAVGPVVWMLATLVSVPVLAHLPLALAHAASERRLGAFFEWRRIRGLGASAGWVVVWIAVLSIVASAVFFALRALPTFIEGPFPEFSTLSPADQAAIAGQIDLASAAIAFVLMTFLRHRAAVVYAQAAPRAAQGRFAHLWTGHLAQTIRQTGRAPSRAVSGLWLLTAYVIWLGLPVLIVAGQFLNYDPVLWSLHPILTLPWAG